MTKKIVLKLKNRLIPPLYEWLIGIFLIGKESRERIKFNKILLEKIKEIGDIKEDMIKPFCKIDDKGKLKSKKETLGKDEKGKDIIRDVFDFKNKKAKEKFLKEWEVYMEEEFVVDVLEGNKSKVYTIKEILLNTEQKFRGEMADLHNEWCEVFEALPPRPEAKR